MKYDGKKVLVTGAGGFIGSHLVERLATLGAQVRVFLHYNAQSRRGWLDDLPSDVQAGFDIFWGDLKDPEAVRRAVQGVDLVFHLGALIAIPYSYQNPTDFFQTNVIGTLHVANACLDAGVKRLIHTSTSEVYGTAKYIPMTEDHPQSAQSPYSASKIGADRVVESYIHSYNLPAVIARPFNTYGPRQSNRAIIPTIVSQVLHAEQVKLGALEPTRDFTYVADTVEAFCRIGIDEEVIGETVHFGSGTEISIGELAHKIMQLIGRDIPIERDDARLRPESSEVDRLICDADKFKRLTGWTPRVTIDEGLGQVIAWLRDEVKNEKEQVYTI